ncbi:hypothetical protein NE237_005002 [Protea cynaroides]|uniref:Uncharacterized protein n=1 Tax=Protea cynaroides TaxID=273540 RepID=A0A9Q0KJT1_9MAGN|nr:hypothetical protein NE237_005002 [Protea cynaroides]
MRGSDSKTLSPKVACELLEGIRLSKDIEFFKSKEDDELFEIIDTGFLNAEGAILENPRLETVLSTLKKAKEESDQKATNEGKNVAPYKKMSFKLGKMVIELEAKMKVERYQLQELEASISSKALAFYGCLLLGIRLLHDHVHKVAGPSFNFLRYLFDVDAPSNSQEEANSPDEKTGGTEGQLLEEVLLDLRVKGAEDKAQVVPPGS